MLTCALCLRIRCHMAGQCPALWVVQSETMPLLGKENYSPPLIHTEGNMVGAELFPLSQQQSSKEQSSPKTHNPSN